MAINKDAVKALQSSRTSAKKSTSTSSSSTTKKKTTTINANAVNDLIQKRQERVNTVKNRGSTGKTNGSTTKTNLQTGNTNLPTGKMGFTDPMMQPWFDTEQTRRQAYVFDNADILVDAQRRKREADKTIDETAAAAKDYTGGLYTGESAEALKKDTYAAIDAETDAKVAARKAQKWQPTTIRDSSVFGLGQFGKGNIDLTKTPRFKNSDGTTSTVDSVTVEFTENGKSVYYLLPSVWYDKDGKAVHESDANAVVKHYRETGQYLGKFKSVEDAEAYAEKLHYSQAADLDEGLQLWNMLDASEYDKLYGDYTDKVDKNNAAVGKYNEAAKYFAEDITGVNLLPQLDDEIKKTEDRIEELRIQNATIPPFLTDQEELTEQKKKNDAEIRELEDNLQKYKDLKYRIENEKKYANLSENEDYAEKSKPGESTHIKWLNLDVDPVFEYINDINGAREKKETQKNEYHWFSNMESVMTVEKYAYMTDEEIANYNYLYNTKGKKAANEYLDYLDYALSDRRSQAVKEEAQQRAEEHPFWASVASVPVNLMAGFGLMDIAKQNLVRNVTKNYKPINYNSNAMSFGAYSSTIRGTISANANENHRTIQLDEEKNPFFAKMLNGKGWGDAYQLGMSMADSFATRVIGSALGIGALGTIMLGGSAGTQGIVDALERGANDKQAIVMGLLNGAFEMLFEYVSMDKLLKSEGKGFLGSLKAFIEQGFTEGSEEFNTTLFNTMADVLVMAQKSDYKRSVAEYMAQNPGMSQAEAETLAIRDVMAGMGFDFIGGFISGSLFSFGEIGKEHTARSYYKAAETRYKNIQTAVGETYKAELELLNQAAQYGNGSMTQSMGQVGLDNLNALVANNKPKKVEQFFTSKEGQQFFTELRKTMEEEKEPFAPRTFHEATETTRQMGETENGIHVVFEKNGLSGQNATNAAQLLSTLAEGGEVSNNQLEKTGLLKNQNFQTAVEQITGTTLNIEGKSPSAIARAVKEAFAAMASRQTVEAAQAAAEQTAQPVTEQAAPMQTETAQAPQVVQTEAAQTAQPTAAPVANQTQTKYNASEKQAAAEEIRRVEAEYDAADKEYSDLSERYAIAKEKGNLKDRKALRKQLEEKGPRLAELTDRRDALYDDFAERFGEDYGSYVIDTIEKGEATNGREERNDLSSRESQRDGGTASDGNGNASQHESVQGDDTGRTRRVDEELRARRHDAAAARTQKTAGITKRISPKSAGIKYGSSERTMTVVPEETVRNWSSDEVLRGDLLDIYADAKTKGVNVNLISGAIEITNPLSGTPGIANGCVIDNKEIYVQINDADETALQIYKHESGHIFLNTHSGALESFIQRCGEYLKPVLQVYAAGYLTKNYDQLTEKEKNHMAQEIFCDACAEFDIYTGTTEEGSYLTAKDFARYAEQTLNDYSETTEIQTSEELGEEEGPMEADVTSEVVDPGDNEVVHFSYRSLAEAAGFTAVFPEDGSARYWVRADGSKVDGSKKDAVTVDDIKKSLIGKFIEASVGHGINEKQAEQEYTLFAKICSMAVGTNDFGLAMAAYGSSIFTALKTNADKQYTTTYDFVSICQRTQAIIDLMSQEMVSKRRGLYRSEILRCYDAVIKSGNPANCPECYVFARWVGIGGLLNNIYSYQTAYADYSVEEMESVYQERWKKILGDMDKWNAEIRKFNEGKPESEQKKELTPGKAKGKVRDEVQKEFDKLQKRIDNGEELTDKEKQRYDQLDELILEFKALTWIDTVFFENESHTKKRDLDKMVVPPEILFDLNRGGEFAELYPAAWGFRTTQGAGYGKAITPPTEAVLGEGILGQVRGFGAKDGKIQGIDVEKKAKGKVEFQWLDKNGNLTKEAKNQIAKARLKQKIQLFLGGQRFQSTSDAVFENASDYLLAALEMQVMQGGVQVYTKVDGAVPAFAIWGFFINQSLMPMGGGLDANGNPVDTSVGGMSVSAAQKNRDKYSNAGTITIGVNDNHIRAMMRQAWRDFIIPYHASGGKQEMVNEMRQLQDPGMKGITDQNSSDYTSTQNDKVLSDIVLRNVYGYDEETIQRIHAVRDARIKILTGKSSKADMSVVKSNRFLTELYNRFNGGEYDGVHVPKDTIESHIFPNEFWDKTISYEDSGAITKDYLEYCHDLGFLHRFSGLVPRNGVLKPVKGYNEKGEPVFLTDLAYKVDENGKNTDEVEAFFWKNLVDHRMYDAEGRYQEQKTVCLANVSVEEGLAIATEFAKRNVGKMYNPTISEQLLAGVRSGEIDLYNKEELSAAAKKLGEKMNFSMKPTMVPEHPEVTDGLNFNDPTGEHIEKVFDGTKLYETRDYKPDKRGEGRIKGAYLNKLTGMIRTGAGKAKMVGYWRLGDGVLRDAAWLSDHAAELGNDGTAYQADENSQKWVYPIEYKERIDTPREVDTWGPQARKLNREDYIAPASDFADQSEEAQAERIESSDILTNFSLKPDGDFNPLRDENGNIIYVYKAFYAYDGGLYPPMIANQTEEEQKRVKNAVSGTIRALETPVGVPLNADVGELAREDDGSLVRNTKGRLAVKNSKGGGTLAFRPGWHLGLWPDAKQFNKGPKGADNKRHLMPDSLVFAKCMISGDVDYQLEAMAYGMSKKGSFDRTQAGLPRVPVNGYYVYRTNADPTTAPWYIAGSMKVVEILDDADCAEICAQYGVKMDPRESGKPINLADYGLKRGPVEPTADLARFDKNAKNYENEAELEKALNDPEYADAYKPYEINFDNEEIIKEFKRNNQDAEYYRKKAQSETYFSMKPQTAKDYTNIINDQLIKMGTMFAGGGTFDAGITAVLGSIVESQFAVEFDARLGAMFAANNDMVGVIPMSRIAKVGNRKLGIISERKASRLGIVPENQYYAEYHGKRVVYMDDVRNVKLTPEQLEMIEYAHASPVCHNYSKAKNNAEETELDLTTANAFADLIRTAPNLKAITVENAKDYQNGRAIKVIVDALDERGFKHDIVICRASDYGGHTIRERLFIRAVSEGELPPMPTQLKEADTSWMGAVKDLVYNEDGSVRDDVEDYPFSDYMLERLEPSKIYPGEMEEDILIIGGNKGETLTWAPASKPSPTILASSNEARIMLKDGRVIRATPRMMARIQGLPDSYKLPKETTDAYKIVGNGVPVELTQAVVMPLLERQLVNKGLKMPIYNAIGQAYLEAAESGDKKEATRLFNKYVLAQADEGITPFLYAEKYNTADHSAIAKALKTGDTAAIERAATEMAELVPENAVLIPMPSRTGKATDTLELAKAISEKTGAPVLDILRGRNRESVYEMKKNGRKVKPDMLGFYAESSIPDGKTALIVDNVVASGTTASAAIRALGQGVVLGYAYGTQSKNLQHLKLADAITYDDNGKVIPLTKRFDINNPDPRFSMKPKFPPPPGVGAKKATGDETFDYEDWASNANRRQTLSDEQRNNATNARATRGAVNIPYKNKDGRITNRTAQTLMNSGVTDDAMVESIKSVLANGGFSHAQNTDSASIKRARDKITDTSWEAAYGEFKAAAEADFISKDNITLGIELYNNAITNGDGYGALDIASLLIKQGSSIGSAMQVLRMLNKLTPEGKLYMAVRSVENIAAEIRKRYGDQIAVNIDRKLLNDYRDALISGDKAEQKRTWGVITKAIADQIPANWAEKINAWRYLSMLGNPRTHIRNLLGNLGFMPVRLMKQAVKAGLERVVLGKTGMGSKRTTALLNVASSEDRARLKAGWADYSEVVDIIQKGGKYDDKWSGVEDERTIFKLKPIEWARDKNGKLLDAEDMWFSRPAYAEAVASALKAKGIDGDDYASGNVAPATKIAVQEIAIAEAQKATYRDLNSFSNLVTKLGRVGKGKDASGVEKAVGTLIEGVLPFKKTPANILVRAVEYSPIEFGIVLANDIRQVKKGNMSVSDMLDHISSGLVGTGLVALGVLLRSLGLVSGGADDDDKQAEFDALRGQQEYAITIGDKNYTIDWLAPAALPMFVGVQMFDALSDKDDDTSALVAAFDALPNLLEPMLNMSMLQSVNDLIESVGYLDDNEKLIELARNALGNLASQFVPTLFGQVERITEDKRYSTYVDKESFLSGARQRAIGKIANKTPGWEYNQVEYVDAWGRTKNTGTVAERVFRNMFSPGYVSADASTSIDDELQRLYDLSGKEKYSDSEREKFGGVLPKRTKQNAEVDNTAMNGEEYVTYAKKRGQMSLTEATKLIDSSAYRHLSDVQKAIAIAKVYEESMSEAENSVRKMRKVETEDGYAAEAGMSASAYGAAYAVYSTAETPKGYEKTDSGATPGWAKAMAVIELDGMSDENKLKYLNSVSGLKEPFESLREAKEYYREKKKAAKK